LTGELSNVLDKVYNERVLWWNFFGTRLIAFRCSCLRRVFLFPSLEDRQC
jgi:hypothetical protein